ncbi:hypothetical protein NWO25_04175 [Enterococcus lactis]|nr:hypothetical protein [Enterococcus lactis]
MAFYLLHNYMDFIDLSVEPIEGIANTSFIEVNRNTNKSKALVKNVGFYKGKKVNLLITLERNRGNLNGDLFI